MAVNIADNIERLRRRLPDGVTLVAVSKFHPAEAVRAAYDAGQRHFGESRVQELLEKAPQLPDDIRWHFIGHLQTNKVQALIGRVHLIHGVDSERLLRRIDDLSARAGVTTRVLMQLHVAREETKYGLTPEEMIALFHSGILPTLRATHICGLMAMASNVDDPAVWQREFATAADTFRTLATDPELALRGFDTLSMGMSHDWPQAVAEGASMIRVGTDIFGPRQY